MSVTKSSYDKAVVVGESLCDVSNHRVKFINKHVLDCHENNKYMLSILTEYTLLKCQ